MGFTVVTKSLHGVTSFFSYSCNNTDARDTYWSLVSTPPNLEVYLSVMFQESCTLDRNLWPQVAVFIVCNGSELAISRRIELASGIARLKRDGTCAETRFGLSAKRTSPFKLAGASVHSTAGSRSVRISGRNGSNAGYTVFWGRVQHYWLPTPLASFPFTSPIVRYRVPSGFNWALLQNVLHCVRGNSFVRWT